MTEQRPLQPTPVGALRFNTDSSKLEYFDGNQYVNITTDSPEQNTGGTRGLFSSGQNPSVFTGTYAAANVIQFIDISTTGDATDFGDRTNDASLPACTADRTRMVMMGGYDHPSMLNTIDFVTVASTGNAADFGDLNVTRQNMASGNSPTRSVASNGSHSGSHNTISYVTTQSQGNAVDFGDTTVSQSSRRACNSPTRMVIGGGGDPSYETIDFITFSTTGNAADFGNLLEAKKYAASASNAVRGLWASGNRTEPSVYYNTIEFVTIATLGNSQDFGDATPSLSHGGACSSSTRFVHGGGSDPSGRTNTMYYVQIMTTGNAVDFGDLTHQLDGPVGASNGHGGLG